MWVGVMYGSIVHTAVHGALQLALVRLLLKGHVGGDQFAVFSLASVQQLGALWSAQLTSRGKR
eukprot:SAG31_NODE_318_length_17799_cov_79.857571_7_plen_63_part_00